ncbi:hypothetical protein U5N28_15290 [Lysinibacillus telephonicus]|uniref:Uncharacterized protein n=1 Tax=Lysinibacillus telephonicus TaxID=1714840 RepID=A0A431UU89_9BACI|nr:hypothetical protein [Lysinibacillus telephonicus]RTQ94012.1 hypothetical protein EKG35_06815 [Lysinibacillus telephonicus]
MRKMNAIIFGSLILATIFGIFGQGMAYSLNENLAKIPPIYYLTVLTIISVLLYLISFVMTFLQYKKHGSEEVNLVLYFSIIGCIGLLTTCWSLFVLAMWWG